MIKLETLRGLFFYSTKVNYRTRVRNHPISVRNSTKHLNFKGLIELDEENFKNIFIRERC